VRLAAGGSTRLGMAELRGLLKAYEIPVVACELVTTPQQAAEAAQRLGFPVALKVVSADIVHKTDVGGVRLGLASPGEVAGAMFSMFTRLHAEHPDAMLSGVLVQKMAERGTELILGAVRDPQFGPVVVVGMGGIYTEVFRDIAARLAPVAAEEARAMLEELRVAPLLRGVRGQRPANLPAVASLVSRFSRLAVDRTDLVEVEINPLMVGSAGGLAVDARATLSPPST
jgi:succinyl-CoA synthetase beta subunit